MKTSDLFDRLAIEDVASSVDRAVDEKQWELVAAHFAESVAVDVGAISGGDAAELPRSAVIQGIVAVNPPDKRAFHSRSNILTRVNGNKASMSAHSYGWNDCARFDPPVYEVWGTMDYDFARIGGQWLITGLRMRKWREAGNIAVNEYRG